MFDKMQKILRLKLWRCLAVVFLSLAIACGVVLEVALSYSSVINDALDITTFKMVETSDDPIDATYFSSDHKEDSAATAAYGREVCEEIESEGLVLLKNEGDALPLKANSAVSLVLQSAYDFSYGSTGSGAIDASKYTDLKTAVEGVGLTVNETLWDFYATDTNANSSTYTPARVNRGGVYQFETNTLPWSMYSDAAKSSISQTGGAAVVVIGRLSGEGGDVSTENSDGLDGSYLSVTEEEAQILEELTAMKENDLIESIVVILNSAMTIDLSFLNGGYADLGYDIDVDACMWVGNVGITGINAVAGALVGDVNPSGRLSDTYVYDNFSSPAMAAWMQGENNSNGAGYFSGVYSNASSAGLGSQQKYYGVYTESIYVGYRYYETRYEDYVLYGSAEGVGEYDYAATVAYPFGHGLSYTTFAYSGFSVTETKGGDYEVTVTVTNTGSVAGKEVVQVYLQKPYTDYDRGNGVEKASVELVGFDKTDVLYPADEANDADKPGSQTLTITVGRENLKTYDANGYKTYILEAGEYYLATGADAHDALNNILAAKANLTSEQLARMVGTGDADFAQRIGEDIALDTTTYASSETGAAVTNRLDFADINKYEGRGSNSVTYVTRNNWTGTWPSTSLNLTATEQMIADLQQNKAIEEEEGASMPAYGADNGYTVASLRSSEEEVIAFDDERWQKLLDQMTFAEQTELVTCGIYGSIAVTSIALPATVAKDGPTGIVDSVEDISFPSEGIWASSFNLELIAKVGDALAEDARACGTQGVYLPGVNIHRAPFGGRAHEYFSEDPFLSGVAVEAEIVALQAKGVTPYVKHFVFNDEEDQRIGVGIWLNEQSARELYLRPFEYAVSPSRGNSHAIMSSFNRAGCIWTSASDVLLQDILRGEFGFDGMVLTDMLSGDGSGFMSYVDGFMNGTDMFLGNGSATALNAFASSPTFANRIRDAVHRILYTYANYSAAMNGMTPTTVIVKLTPWWQSMLTAGIAVFAVLGGLSAVLTALSVVNKQKRIPKKKEDHSQETAR